MVDRLFTRSMLVKGLLNSVSFNLSYHPSLIRRFISVLLLRGKIIQKNAVPILDPFPGSRWLKLHACFATSSLELLETARAR